MEFFLVTAGMVIFIVLVLVVLGRAYPGSGADLLDWKPTRDYETEFQLEEDDVQQMIAAQNAYRRKRGAKELTEMDAERMAREDQRVREKRPDGRAVAVRDRSQAARALPRGRIAVTDRGAGAAGRLRLSRASARGGAAG